MFDIFFSKKLICFTGSGKQNSDTESCIIVGESSPWALNILTHVIARLGECQYILEISLNYKSSIVN